MSSVMSDDRDAVPRELPDRQPRALEEGPRLVGEDPDLLPLLDRGPDDAEGRPVRGRRQRPRIAVGQDRGSVRDDVAAVDADRPVRLRILALDRLGLLEERPLHRPQAGAAVRFVGRPHPLQRPEEVPGRRPRPLEPPVDALEIGLERAGRLGAHGHDAEDEPVGRGDADRRRPADDHLLDGLGDLDVGPAADVDLLGREFPLVDHDHGLAAPGDRRQHRRLRATPSSSPGSGRPSSPTSSPRRRGPFRRPPARPRPTRPPACRSRRRPGCRCRGGPSPRAGPARGP